VSGKAGKRQPTYTPAFRADAVRLVEQSQKSVRAVAGDLGVSTEALRRWVQQTQIDAGRGPNGALTTEERDELRRLRRENATLRMEREILKKAAAFFAKETS
jgi:transposase-like protein